MQALWLYKESNDAGVLVQVWAWRLTSAALHVIPLAARLLRQVRGSQRGGREGSRLDVAPPGALRHRLRCCACPWDALLLLTAPCRVGALTPASRCVWTGWHGRLARRQGVGSLPLPHALQAAQVLPQQAAVGSGRGKNRWSGQMWNTRVAMSCRSLTSSGRSSASSVLRMMPHVRWWRLPSCIRWRTRYGGSSLAHVPLHLRLSKKTVRDACIG